MNNNLLTGVNLKVFYSSDVGNSSPSSSSLKQVNEIAAFPVVAVQNQAAKLETYDNDYASVLMGDKSIEAFPITVNLIPDDISHQYLTQAADNQSVLQVKVQYEEAGDQEAFILLNGYITSYSDSGDKDSAVTRSFIFTPETLVAQGIADVQPVLRQGDFGVGSNGVDTPQYQLPMAGNGFIQIPGTSSENPASANLIGVGLTNQGRESGLVISESGDLKLYARNSSTAWTRIYSSTEADNRYARLGQPANFGTLSSSGNLSVNGTITSNGQIIAPSGNGFQTALNGDYYSSISAEGGYAMLWRYNTSVTKANEFVGIDSSSRLVFRQATDNVGNYTSQIVYHMGNKPNKNDIGLGNVINTTQLTITNNLSDLSNKATAKTNLGLEKVLNVPSYSKTEVDSTYVPKTLKINGHPLNTDIDILPSDLGIIPIINGGTGGATVPTARANLGLDTGNNVTFRTLTLNATDPTLTLGTAIVRSNSAGQMVLSSTQGIFLRPKGDTESTVQAEYNANGNFTLTGSTLSVGGNTNNFLNIGGGTLRGTTGAAAALVISSSGNGGIHLRPKGDLDQTSSVVYGQDGVMIHTAAPLKLDTNSILTLGTPLAITSGGTGANNAASARTNLGIAYGTAAGTVAQGNDNRLNTVNAKSGGLLTGGIGVNNGVSGVSLNQTGTYMLWNEQSGTGISSIINNPGSGMGGLWIRLINDTNTVEKARFSFSPDGTITSPLGVYSVYGRVRSFASVGPTYLTVDVDGANKGINFFDSDIRLKENIKVINEGTALAQLNQVKPVSYKFKDTYWTDRDNVKNTMTGKSYSYGVIAQELIEVIPDCVNVMDDEQGSMSLDPLAVIGFLLSVSKDLAAEIESIKSQLNK